MHKALALLLLLSTAAYAQHESEYTRIFCTQIGGEVSYKTYMGTWVDCITDKYAIEVDRAEKWYEAIGQAEHYAAATAREPGILLIVGPGEQRFVKRLRMTNRVRQMGIQIWTVPE